MAALESALAALSNATGKTRRKRPLVINRDLYEAANPRIDDLDKCSQIHVDTLNAEMCCPICLRLMRDPMATECLHRFCKDCIEKSSLVSNQMYTLVLRPRSHI